MPNNNMKRIILTSLFFCLTITTILAQVVTTNIATPVAGLSTNSVTDFDVNSDGTILNNSAASGTATLGSTAVTGNSNITAGSEASLILFQVTSTSNTSDLNGQIEVFGGEAGLIIANPNGIECNGCAFTNVNRVDLVTGSGYDAGTNTFSTIAARNIIVDSGSLDASSVAVLNIQTGANFSNVNGATISADTINFTVVLLFNENATINANELNVTAGTTFFNQNGSTINANELNVTAGADFYNQSRATINADNLNITAGKTFFNGTATINTNNFNFIGNVFFNQRNGIINVNDFNVTARSRFENDAGAVISADTVTIEVTNFADNIINVGAISATSLNFILTDDFTRSSGSFAGFNNFSNLTVTTDGTFTNNDTITLAGNLEITANSFTNTGRVIADTFNLSGNDDFDYANRGTITANAFNLNVDGNFSNNDANSNFTWGNNYSLNVSGNADITTNNYNQSGAIDVAGILTVNANNYTYNRPNDDFIWGANDSLTVLGDANITAAEFENSGTITANALNLSVAGDFDYRTDFLNAGTITADNLNFTARDGVFTNDTTIELAGNLGITANSFTNTGGVVSADTFALSVAGDFDYVTEFLNNGTISNDALNLTVGGNFTNDDENNDFVWNANDTLTVLGNADITANSFNNSGNISADTFDLSVVGDFDYADRRNVTANNFNLDVGGNFSNNDASDDFVLAENDSLSISGNFTIDTNNYIQFGTLVVQGALAIIAENNFFNSGNINVTNSLDITAGYTAINQGSIVSASLDLTAADFFRNLTGGDINVDSLNITAGGKVTNTANITVGTLTITANNDSARTNDTTGFYVSNRGNIIATTLNIEAVDNFYNRGNITATNFTTSAKSVFFLNKEISSYDGIYDGGTISLSGDSSFRADGGSIENYGNIDLGGFDLIVVADSFINHVGANVTADTLNLTVNSFVNDGFIDATIDQ